MKNISFMLNVRRACLFAFLLAIVCAMGNTTWHSNTAKNTGTAAEGNNALTNMSYWIDGDGLPGSGTPTASDDLIFDNISTQGSGQSLYRLRIDPRIINDDGFLFTGNSLQIGTPDAAKVVVYDGGSFRCNGEGLKFCNGSVFINQSYRDRIACDIYCDVTILANDPNAPFMMYVGQQKYTDRTARILGKLKGAADAQFLLGFRSRLLTPSESAQPSATNTTFRLSDISEYAGTISVASKFENVMTEKGGSYGVRLLFDTGTTTSQAKIRVGNGGSIGVGTLGSTVTVKELSLADGSILWFDQHDNITDGKELCIRATDSLSIEEGDRKIQLYWKSLITGSSEYRIPILAGPSTSTFTTNNFRVTLCDDGRIYNPDMHLEVGNDPVTGDRTLYVVARGLIDQLSCYPGEGERDEWTIVRNSSLTNAAAWTDGRIPDAANSSFIYHTSTNLRTVTAYNSDYAFPCAGFLLDNGKIVMQTRSFEVPELWCVGGTICMGSGHKNYYPVISFVAPKMHFIRGEGVANTAIHSFDGNLLIMKGEIDGPADIDLRAFGFTSDPTALFLLDGFNTNFTGRLSVSSDEIRPQYHNFEAHFPTLYVSDGRNLGGRRPEFDPRALKLTTFARLSVTNGSVVTLADGLNRGIYIKDSGRFHVTGSGVLDVKWPLLLTGKMWKEGDGTLVLGGATRHEVSGAVTDVPCIDSNDFEIVEGVVKIANADALAGVETTIGAAGALSLVFNSDDAELTRYGIRNTTVDTPFTLDASHGGTLPLSVDVSGFSLSDSFKCFTNGIVTVRTSAAGAVGAMLPELHPWRGENIASHIEAIPDAASGTTTFALVSRYAGMMFIIK